MTEAARKMVFVSISVLVSLLFLELTSWLLYDLAVPKRGRHAVALMLGDAVPDDDFPVQRRPYLFYINRPYWEHAGATQHNRYGYRGPDVAPVRNPDTLRILTIGGSTTYGWLLESWEQAWPAQLQKLLQQKSRCPVEVLNAGLPGGMSSEGLIGYLFRDRYLQPQIVIIHNGGNDAGPLWFADYQPDYSTYRTWGSTPLTARQGEQLLLSSSNLARFAYGLWLSDWTTGNFVPMPPQFPPPDEALSNVKRNSPEGYRRYLSLLVRNVLEDGATPILFPFHLASDEVFQLVEPEFRYVERHAEANRLSIEKNIAVMKHTAREYAVPLAAMPAGSIPLEYFFDHAHLKTEGEGMKAQFMAHTIHDLLAETLPAAGSPRASDSVRRWASSCLS